MSPAVYRATMHHVRKCVADARTMEDEAFARIDMGQPGCAAECRLTADDCWLASVRLLLAVLVSL